MSCLETFLLCQIDNKTTAECLDFLCPDFGCELDICSPFSPGIVSDHERLLFLLINPTHYDAQRRTVVPDAFRELVNRDLSVIRIDVGTKEDVAKTIGKLIEAGVQKNPPQAREVSEGCVVTTGDLRKVKIDGRRVFAIYDTALSDIQAHASIFTSSVQRSSSQLRKRVVAELYRVLANERVELASLA